MDSGVPGPAPDDAERIRVVRAYHDRTKHRRERFAPGPETIDWSAPPRPFRRFEGAPSLHLPLTADTIELPYGELGRSRGPAAALDLAAVGALLELSFGLSAWKESGPDRWALRCNPSSGNLHPTEAYVLTRGVAGLPDALWHYDPGHHALELRCPLGPDDAAPAALWVGLSSIHWRETWKYGERAFRYCQLDLGHALGALRYAAACLGWTARLEPGLGSADIATVLGLDRTDDFHDVEPEDPEAMVQVGPPECLHRADDVPRARQGWMGRAERLDPHPMYRWPVIDDVACASRLPSQRLDHPEAPAVRPADPGPAARAVDLIRQRRSAQAYARRAVMPAGTWWSLLSALQADRLPWDLWPHGTHVHALMLVHRVEGLAPGLYALPRSDAGAALLRSTLPAALPWVALPGPAGAPTIYTLREAALGATARLLSCAQAIAQDACVTWSFLAEFDASVERSPSSYRTLHQEAGLLGQVLYLEAEAHGLRGTGIGCFFDDDVHEHLLALADQRLQVLYHFCVGEPLHDPRIRSHPPYPESRYAWRPLA